ncbi:MAG: SIR2 family protein [Prochloraceae cyanobacterium]|nr:SIR2 family protein [Prochloraceae cyanobacterium]
MASEHVEQQRLKDLEYDLDTERKRLNEFEEQLSYATDDREIIRLNRDIERQKQAIANYQKEREKLQQLTSGSLQTEINQNSKLETLEDHYNSLMKAIIKGRIVPFLGSDINLCDRSIQGNGKPDPWKPGCPFPPSGKELAAYLAKTFPPEVKKIICPLCKEETDTKPGELPPQCPLIDEIIHEPAILISPHSKCQGLNVGAETLQHLSQYAYLTQEEKFYDELELLELGSQPNKLHRFFAKLPAIMREKGHYPPYPLIVTTNYDSGLERAFEEAKEPFDLVFYSNTIDAQEHDRFVHRTPDGIVQEIENPNEYKGFSFEQRPVILKLYGTADLIREGESLVITEENYIEYLVSRNVSNLLPIKLLRKLRNQRPHILFLGYVLSNWNQRIILHRIWPDLTSRKRYKWWAIQSKSDPFAQKLWQSYNVIIHDLPLSKYIEEISKRVVEDIPAKRVTNSWI